MHVGLTRIRIALVDGAKSPNPEAPAHRGRAEAANAARTARHRVYRDIDQRVTI